MGKTKKKISKSLLFYIVGLAILFAVFVCGLLIGNVSIPLKTSLRVIFKKLFFLGDVSDMGDAYNRYASIIITLRTPRVLSCIIIGACLSLAGAVMQGLLKNPLADGSVMGVSSGASVGAVLSIVMGASIPAFFGLGMGLFAVAFAFASLLAVMGIARVMDKSLSSQTIILVGVIFSMLASSVTGFLTIIAGDKLQSVVFWSMGSMQRTDWKTVYLVLPVMLVCMAWVMRFFRELNAFGLGEDEARYVGVNVKSVKIQLLVVVSLLVGVSVAVCGNIAFVGLIVPHIARKIVGPNHKHLLPASMIIGGIFLTLADILARSIMPPLELPIGIVTSAVGAVFFLVVFIAKRKGR